MSEVENKKEGIWYGNDEYSRIVFERYGDRTAFPLGIFTLNPDGGDCLQIRQTGKCPEWSPDGNWIAFEDLPEGYEDYATSIYIMKPNGKDVRQLTRHTDGRACCPTWSPDSKKVCYSLWKDEGSQIWTVDIESLQQKRLTHEDDSYPFWTPFNKIVFNRERFVLIMDPDGKNQRYYDIFVEGDEEPRWSRDGKKIVFIRDGDVCVMDADGSNLQTIPIAPESAPAYRAAKASLSPDGRKIAYSSRQRKLFGYEIYVMDVDGKNKQRITTHPLGSDGGEVSSIGICWSPWLKIEKSEEKNEDEKYVDISNLLKMAEEDPDGILSTTSSLLESDKSLMSNELIRSQRFVAYSTKATNAIKSLKPGDTVTNEIIDLIEKALIEAKAADDASEDKQNDYFRTERVNLCAKILGEVKPGRVQELWGKTKLDYFGNRVKMHEAVELTEEEIWEDFGKIFFTFPYIVKYAAIMNPSSREYITVYLSGERYEDLQGWIRIFRDGTVKVDEVFYDKSKIQVEQDNIESNEVDRNTAANEHYNRGVLAADKGLYARAIQEYEKALEYNPSPEAKILITCNLATTLLLKIDVPNRKGGGSDLSDEEYKDLQKSLGLYEQVIKMYEGLGEDAVLESKLPLKELHDQARTNIKAYGPYGLTKWDEKKGHLVFRNSKPTEEEIREKRQTLESEIKGLKQERSKKYSEAGKIAYAKYKNDEPNFTGGSDIRIKWYAILAIDLEINKINKEIEALNSREKKSRFFAKMGDLISTTAKQGKSKIDLYSLGKRKDNTITEFGEQLYIDHKKETINLEELSSTWQGVGELEKQINAKEDEISRL